MNDLLKGYSTPEKYCRRGEMMIQKMRSPRRFLAAIFLIGLIAACGKNDNTSTNPDGNNNNGDTYDIDNNGIPQFVNTDYIDLAKIGRISKFRSSVGHDYSDAFESCRSMKHYFEPKSDVDWSSINISSPVSGTISRIFDEWAGTQVQIRSAEFPAFYFIIFHINLVHPLNVGDTVDVGQLLGNHIGSQTMSDIAVGVNTPNGWKLISYFDVMTDSLFGSYQGRGLTARSVAIISKAERDADPLTCDGELFQNQGNIENWVTLN